MGSPTTAVFASNLSERAILDAIRAGRVFVDVEGVAGRHLELSAARDGVSAAMGETLAARAGETIQFTLTVKGLAGAKVDVVMDGAHGAALADAVIDGDDAALCFSLTADGARHWIRTDVRSADAARTLMIGNPIYLNG